MKAKGVSILLGVWDVVDPGGIGLAGGSQRQTLETHTPAKTVKLWIIQHEVGMLNAARFSFSLLR